MPEFILGFLAGMVLTFLGRLIFDTAVEARAEKLALKMQYEKEIMELRRP